MQHLLKRNLALITTRMLSTKKFQHAYVSDTIGDRCLVSIKTRETGYFFPLFLYKETGRISNFSKDFLARIKENYEIILSSKKIFNYIYAILYSQSYRDRYNEFLRIDYPKIPITSNKIFIENQMIPIIILSLRKLDFKSLK